MLSRFAKYGLIFGAVVGLGIFVGYLLWPSPDPRVLALGEWRDEGSHLRVEVQPKSASWRGMHRGKLTYQWLQYEDEPYLVRLTWRNSSIDARVSFSGDSLAIVEPIIWDILPDSVRKIVRDVNRQHGRPEREIRLVLRRIPSK